MWLSQSTFVKAAVYGVGVDRVIQELTGRERTSQETRNVGIMLNILGGDPPFRVCLWPARC